MSDQSEQHDERDDAESEAETVEDLERGASAAQDVVGGGARRTPDDGPDLRRGRLR